MSESLKREATKFFDLDLGLTREQKECFQVELGRFCLSGKKEDAFSVYYCYSEIFKVFGDKNTFGELVAFLSDHEFYSGELLQKHRDHYSHSVYVFALGLSLYANNKVYRDYIKSFYKGFTDRDFLFHWGLIGLFHDIGYPFQLAHEQIRDYVKKLFDGSVFPNVAFENMTDLLKISDRWIKESGYQVKDLNEFFTEAICKRLPYLGHYRVLDKLTHRPEDAKFMDHGYFSALLLANKLQETDISLTEPLIDSLSAVLLHNSLIRHYIAREDASIPPTSMESHPLCYLIMLCDELQCWDREAFGLVSKKSPIAWDFALSYQDNSVDLYYTYDTEITGYREDGRPIFTNNNANKAIATKEEDGLLKDINTAVKPHLEIIPHAIAKKKEKKTQTYASSNKLLALEQIALATHQSYSEQFNNYPAVAEDFAKLPLFYKLDNIDQAKSYAYKLELVNCMYSEKELDYPVVSEFDEKDASYLAAQEHVRWVKNRIRYGWTYGVFGKDYNRANREEVKKHKSIVPYEILSQEEKDKDIVTINNMIKFLNKECDGIKVYSFRDNWKPVLKIFGSGHRTIDLSDIEQVTHYKEEIAKILKEYQKTNRVIVKTCFARGSDLLIAEVALELGISIDACVPYSYEKTLEDIKIDSKRLGYRFNEEDEMHWRNLIAQTIFYHEIDDKNVENPYAEALKYSINQCSVMIVLWDEIETLLTDLEGKPINRGGTYHGIVMAKERGMKVHVIPCKKM